MARAITHGWDGRSTAMIRDIPRGVQSRADDISLNIPPLNGQVGEVHRLAGVIESVRMFLNTTKWRHSQNGEAGMTWLEIMILYDQSGYKPRNFTCKRDQEQEERESAR